MRRFTSLVSIGLLWAAGAIGAAPENISVSVDATKPGATISRHLFGQFAEHLGQGIYGGVWVGRTSPIPNTRGIRNDVVAALRALHVPNVRWPGGCFADYYHWRSGIGPQRAVTLNPDRCRPLHLGQHWLRHTAGSRGLAGVHDQRATHHTGKGTRCQRSPGTLADPHSRARQ